MSINVYLKTVAFGGSGYSKNGSNATELEESPILLMAPVRMIDTSGLQPLKATYGGAIISEHDDEALQSKGGSTVSLHNALLDIKQVPLTQKDIRKLRKESEQLQRMLKIEAALEAQRRTEMAQVNDIF